MVQTIWLTLFVVLIVALAAALFALYYMGRDPKGDGRDAYEEYARPDYTDKAGFYLDSIPENDILSPIRYWLVNETIAEIEYLVVPDHQAFLRVAETGQLAVPTDYQEENYESQSVFVVEGTTATLQQTTGRKNLLTWTRDEFDFALYGDFPEMNLFSGISNEFIPNAHAKKSTGR